MGLLEQLFDDAQRARQEVVLARAKDLEWLEHQLQGKRRNSEGYERLRHDLTIREMRLAMLKSISDEEYARYEREQIRVTARSNRRITRLLTVVAIGSCLAAGVQAWCAFFPRPQASAPCVQGHK